MSKLDEILERLTKIEVLLVERDKQCAAHVARIAKLEHTVNGNGKTGLAEEVRNLKWRWGLLMAGVALVASWAPSVIKFLIG